MNSFRNEFMGFSKVISFSKFGTLPNESKCKLEFKEGFHCHFGTHKMRLVIQN
jgi:hypothetical protein